MGLIIGKLRETAENKKRGSVIAWGDVVYAPEITHFRKKKCKFRLRFGYKQLVDIEAWDENDITSLMENLDENDTVLVCGEYREDSYETGGEMRTRSYIAADLIAPLSTLLGAQKICASPNVVKLLQDEYDDSADEFEPEITPEDEAKFTEFIKEEELASDYDEQVNF